MPLLIFQYLFGDCTGVFWVSIDLRPAKRLPNDDCATHTLPMFGWNAGVIESAFRNFPEDIRFGEFFRADYNWIGER